MSHRSFTTRPTSMVTRSLALAFALGLAPGCPAANRDRQVDEPAPAVVRPQPAEVYGTPEAPVRLLVGNGGAALIGLLRALSEDFLSSHHKEYAIGWVKAGSGENFDYIRRGQIDMALTYEPLIEKQLLEQGIVTNRRVVFHDRFIVVGPISDPAGIRRMSGEVADVFMHIAEAGVKAPTKVRFLSRMNTSGATAKEHYIWNAIQMRPWEDSNAAWYVRFDSFPTDALERADAIGAYTLNDLGIWLANPTKRAHLEIFRQDGAILDNPCSVILRAGAATEPEAVEFADYLLSRRAQKLIAEFGRSEYGQALYQPALFFKGG